MSLLADIDATSNIYDKQQDKDRFQADLENKLHQHLDQKPRLSKTDEYLRTAYTMTKKFKTDHPNLVNLKTDKTKKVTVIEKQTYDQKMDDLLNDPTVYQTSQRVNHF